MLAQEWRLCVYTIILMTVSWRSGNPNMILASAN
jgi:hypothetical protein